MPEFRPRCGDVIELSGERYQFLPHPLFAEDEKEPFALEGGEATIFQMLAASNNARFALKVMKPAFRSKSIVRSTQLLTSLADVPGFALARRFCLTPAEHATVIEQHPQLVYAVMMPWLDAITWAGIMQHREMAEGLTMADLLRFAATTAQALWQLEARQMAHGDVAGSNVALHLNEGRIDLLDLDHIFAPTLPPLAHPPRGTRGYQHRALDQRGQWRADGDRFATAMLLTEMLVWGDPMIRALIPIDAETLFQPRELQTMGLPIWQAVRQSLWTHWPELLALFDAAWTSASVAECPDLSTWALCLTHYLTRAGLAQ